MAVSIKYAGDCQHLTQIQKAVSSIVKLDGKISKRS